MRFLGGGGRLCQVIGRLDWDGIYALVEWLGRWNGLIANRPTIMHLLMISYERGGFVTYPKNFANE